MKLADAVLRTIRRQRLVKAGDRVAVACSGGADSVALLLLLHQLHTELGIRLGVAHVNHQLRGAAADADEAFVRALAQRFGLEFIARRVDVAARARRQKANLEEAGRQARLEFFTALCSEGKADAIATAHTLDDQAETLLARLLRGTGLTGLAGIHPVLELAHGCIVRPLLEARRAELREFLREQKQQWREDASNLDPARARNRIRQELLPRLERLSPAVLTHLAHLATQARQEESFWQALTEERLRTLVQEQAGEWRIPARSLLEPLGDFYTGSRVSARQAEETQHAVAQRLVRRVVEAVRGSARRLTQRHIEQVLRLAASAQSGQLVALPGLWVERSFDWLVFRAGRRTVVPYRFEVSVPGSVEIEAAGERLHFKLVPPGELQQGYNGGRVAALDADVLSGQRVRGTEERAPRLTVRNWRPGDRFRPLGAAHAKKLKTLFQREQVPLGERASCPVVVSAEEIVWVRRLGVAAGCAVGERTRTALVIVEEPLEEMTR